MKVYVFTSHTEESNEIKTIVFSTEKKALAKMLEFRNKIEEYEGEEIISESKNYVSYYNCCGYINKFSYKEYEVDVE